MTRKYWFQREITAQTRNPETKGNTPEPNDAGRGQTQAISTGTKIEAGASKDSLKDVPAVRKLVNRSVRRRPSKQIEDLLTRIHYSRVMYLVLTSPMFKGKST